MKTFEEIFCEETSCPRVHFQRTLFWKTMPFYAWIFVPVLGGVHSTHFEAERRLIDGLALAEDMRDVRALINDYLGDTAEHSWLRTVSGTEVSLRKLKEVARAYLPGNLVHTANPFEAFQKIEQ